MLTGRTSIFFNTSAAAAPSAPQRSDGEQAEQRAISFLTRCAIFTITFGPGAAVATYTTTFGWYQNLYNSKELLVWMRIALFTPFPLIKAFQLRYDAYFDEVFSTRAAYLFRIVIMQLVLAMLMVAWMLLPYNVSELVPVIVFGVLLGACAAPFIGSTAQIAVALDPVLLIWAQLGNTVGMSVPVLAEFVFQFSSTSSHKELCGIIAVPMVICILTAIWLGSLHYAEVFSSAYQVIAARRPSQVPPPATAFSNPQDEMEDLAPVEVPISNDSDLTSALRGPPDSQTNLRDFPLWVWCWLGMQAIGTAFDFFTLSLIGYFGEASTTHHLAAGTLIAASCGRLLSLGFRYLPAFQAGPLHIVGAGMFCARVCLWIIILLVPSKIWKPSVTELLSVWCFWQGCSMIHNSLTDMTVASNVAPGKRQVVAQLGLMVTYSALFLGMVTASCLVIGMEDDKLSGDVAPSL